MNPSQGFCTNHKLLREILTCKARKAGKRMKQLPHCSEVYKSSGDCHPVCVHSFCLEMKITSKVNEIIKPASPSAAGIIPLSNNDQIVPRLYTRFLLFFSPNNTTHHEQQQQIPLMASDQLKASLAQALTLFFPLAGRYRVRQDQGLEIDCNDQGVEFSEAEADTKLADFGGFKQHDPEFEPLSPCSSEHSGQIDKIKDIPLVLIQVTRFKCGGASLVVALHHNVGDGLALSSFIQAWSQIASGKQALVQLPSFDHSPLNARSPPSPSQHHVEYQTQLPRIPASFPEMRSRMFKFGPDCIEASKSQCHPGTTRFEAIAGHIWRSVTKARRLEPLEETKLGMAVDGRNRFLPPLPEGYFGNVIFYACAASTVKELVGNPLSYAAGLVRDATHRITDEYMRSAVDWIEQQDSPLKIFPAFCDARTDLAMTSWSRFPLYDADFGWGKPVFFGMPVAAWTGLVIFMPDQEESSMTALVGLFAEQMENLLADPDLNLILED